MANVPESTRVGSEFVLHISGEDAKRFLYALDNPFPANEQLKSLMRNYAACRQDYLGCFDWGARLVKS